MWFSNEEASKNERAWWLRRWCDRWWWWSLLLRKRRWACSNLKLHISACCVWILRILNCTKLADRLIAMPCPYHPRVWSMHHLSTRNDHHLSVQSSKHRWVSPTRCGWVVFSFRFADIPLNPSLFCYIREPRNDADVVSNYFGHYHWKKKKKKRTISDGRTAQASSVHYSSVVVVVVVVLLLADAGVANVHQTIGWVSSSHHHRPGVAPGIDSVSCIHPTHRSLFLFALSPQTILQKLLLSFCCCYCCCCCFCCFRYG